ncbi:MAG TPA: penicillin-binding protein activator [Steroidobacteraceae bacterium]|nr:penicillin-binding protein activator [Steroidobacteraceae bacterium]
MLIARWIVRCAVITAAALALTGCPSITRQVELPPSVDRAEALARQGDQGGAAKIYEALAEQNSGADRNEFVFRATRAYLAARLPDEAARVLGTVQQPLNAKQNQQYAFLDVDVTLARGQGAQAWQKISAMPVPATIQEAAEYFRIRQQAAFAAGRPADAVAAEISAEPWLSNAQELRQSRVNLLGQLRDANDHGAKIDPRASNDPVVRGWLELGPLAALAARNPGSAIPQIEVWRARNPNHPAAEIVRTQLLGAQQGPIETAEAHIALLLPISGRAGAAATQVRDGFMTAYYQSAPAQRPRVRVYDTGEGGSIADAITRATQEGAEFIVGPLTREEVVAAADLASPHPPILALNFLPSERPAPATFYQYALSPEDEARLAARRILDDGHRHGVAIVPSGDWGIRVLAAFKQELEAGGGSLFAATTVDAAQTDYSDPVMQILRISDSRARHKRLESILGTKLEFEPRRRADLEFIFAPGQASMERLLRPQLRFHYAGDVPTYATSDAFEPDTRSNQDLEGLMFPDMPWMLGGDLADAVRAAVRDAWPNGGPRRGRLFAFGFDSYRLAVALRARGVSNTVSIEGLTGHLSLDADRRVHRDLNWAQIHDGEVKLLQPPAQAAPAAAQVAPAGQ